MKKTSCGKSARSSSMTERLDRGLLFVLLCLLPLAASCTSTPQDEEVVAESGEDSHVSVESEPTFAARLRELYEAPYSEGGSGRGGSIGRSVMGGKVESRHFRLIPAIEGLVRGPEDIDAFEVLLVLLRDVDFSIHSSARAAMHQSYPISLPGAFSDEEQLDVYKEAQRWWDRNRDRLVWNAGMRSFILSTERRE